MRVGLGKQMAKQHPCSLSCVELDFSHLRVKGRVSFSPTRSQCSVRFASYSLIMSALRCSEPSETGSPLGLLWPILPMALTLLAALTVLLVVGRRHSVGRKGDFLRLARAHQPAKSLPSIHGTLHRWRLPCSQMAKVDLEGLFSEVHRQAARFSPSGLRTCLITFNANLVHLGDDTSP